MSYASDLGYKVGDKFRVIEDSNSIFHKGEIIVLEEDDGSRCPIFASVSDSNKNNFMYITSIEDQVVEVEKIEEPKTVPSQDVVISLPEMVNEIRKELSSNKNLLERIKQFIKEYSKRFDVDICINDKGFSLCFDWYEFDNLDDNELLNKMNLLEQLFGVVEETNG